MTNDELLGKIQEAVESGQDFLNLANQELTYLPPEIGQLTGLRHLALAYNRLTSLPVEIGNLTNLVVLDVTGNRLTALPKEVNRLSHLRRLYLNDNEFVEFPVEITQLPNIWELALNNNRITTLPPEIHRLKNLMFFSLHDNPLPIPPEILHRSYDSDAIISYFFEYQAGQKRPLNEAKVLVVGQGSVGKTSLVKRLMGGEFNARENKTDGIDIQRWQVGVNGQSVRLNVWDFGGQEIMHATHQFFLTKRSLYVLVMDVRLNEEENRLEYWLKIIQSFGKDSPVIVVGNKVDQQGLDLDRRGLQAKYPNIKAFVETSCQTAKCINEL